MLEHTRVNRWKGRLWKPQLGMGLVTFFYWIFDRYSTSMSTWLLTSNYNGNITRLPLVTCKTGLLSEGFATNTAVRLLSCMCVAMLEHSWHLCECSITDGASIALLSTMDAFVTCKCMFVYKCFSTYITHVTTDSWVHHLRSITQLNSKRNVP
jgi:hypothetical protein